MGYKEDRLVSDDCCCDELVQKPTGVEFLVHRNTTPIFPVVGWWKATFGCSSSLLWAGSSRQHMQRI